MAHNPKLADKQNVSELNRKVIDKLHILRYFIEQNVKELVLVKDELKQELVLANYEEWFENEKLLQELWNFPEDENYIKFWTFPACSCPKMDNDDAYPTGFYIHSQGCLIHGWKGK